MWAIMSDGGGQSLGRPKASGTKEPQHLLYPENCSDGEVRRSVTRKGG